MFYAPALNNLLSNLNGWNMSYLFDSQLERSQDGFSVVADYFGRGVFNKV